MEIEKRKIQKIAGSYLITLPKSWVNQYNLKKGSEVWIRFENDGNLKILPRIEELSKKEWSKIKYDRYIIRKISREYLFASDVIEIVSERDIGRKEREEIADFLKKLMNIEIIEEDSKRIVIENFGYRRMPMVQALRRMYLLTNNMLDDLIQKNKEGLENMDERDNIVDKFYFMIVMHTRTYLEQGLYTLPEKELTLLRCLDFRLASEKIERIGDLLKKSAELYEQIDDEILNVLIEIKEEYKKAFFSFLSEDFNKACELWDKKEGIRKKLIELEERFENVEKLKLIQNISQVYEHIVDIADLVR
ncbi:MAG: AbrB/MazE/SpoVT family DNA-binding domain-containing protein [Candidatus Hydrothermarchaeota archaeon]